MTDRYAVMGNPIAHSKSPLIHRRFAEQTGQDLDYEAILVPENGLSEAVSHFREQGGKGLNITVPFKHDAWELVDERNPAARIAGAVNTIIINSDGSLVGDNTDGVGMLRDIRDNLGRELPGSRILVLGAGGAVAGVLDPLIQESPEQLVIANRTESKAEELAGRFNPELVTGCGLDNIPAGPYDLIVNGTSASLHGETLSLPSSLVTENSCCYDMMYAREDTPFMHWARQCGCTCVSDGLGMLVEQAAESFFLWRGVRPQTADTIDYLRNL